MLTVCRLPKEGSNKFYRLQTEWDGESFSMLILDEVSAWTGKLSSLELNHLSRQLFLGNEEYINETRKALTSDGGDEQFTYSIENHQFSWKKVDVETDIRVKYGFVHLMNVPVFEAFENMIDILLDRNQFLQQQVKNLENLKDSMEKETNVLKEKCRNYCEEKAEMEIKLYSKFIPLLNGKKERIENLEAKLRKGHAAKPEMDLRGTKILSSDSDVDDPELLIDKKSSIFKTNNDSAKHKRSRNKNSSKEILKKPQSKQKEINLPTKLSSKKLCLHLDTKIKEKEHYSSDTEVDENDTDENDESLFAFVDENDESLFAFVSTEPKQRTDMDLFSELNSPDSVLPKRIKQDIKPGPSRTVPYEPVLTKQDTKPGPSGTAPYKPEMTTQVHTFSTQDLFSDI